MNKKKQFLPVLLSLMLLAGGMLKAQCPTIYYGSASTDPLITSRYMDGPTGSSYVNTPNPVTHQTEPATIRCYWDTAVSCKDPVVTIKCTTFVTTGRFTGYRVDPIPYNPPDSTFMSTAGGGARIALSSDDNFDAPGLQQLPFDFSFFGHVYSWALVGPNGTVKFGTQSELQSMVGQNQNYVCCNHPLVDDNGNVTGFAGNAWNRSIWNTHCDIWPTTASGNQGLYRAVYDEYPCRKLVVNINHVPKYGGTLVNKYATVQTVCYEGTNIIEVHIQHIDPEETASGSCYCNATALNWGTAAESTGADELPITCQQAYPIPVGTNAPYNNNGIVCNQIRQNEAWRWTPVGITVRNVKWYYGTDTSKVSGRVIETTEGDSIICAYATDPYDDTTLTVRPTVPTTYTARMLYIGAGGYEYDLCEYITVGVNYDHEMSFSGDTILCVGEGTAITITQGSTPTTRPEYTRWALLNDDAQGTMARNLHLANLNEVNGLSLEIPPFISQNIFNTCPDSNEIVLQFRVTTDFTNGCNDSVRINVHFVNNNPHLGDTLVAHICEGGSYQWDRNQEFYQMPGAYSYTYDTVFYGDTERGMCPKTRILRLWVEKNKDTLYNVKDCKPYTWINGETYENTTTDRIDNLRTIWGCDSVIRLNYVRDEGLAAIIDAVPAHATLDKLHIQLKDMSLGSDARKWWFPDMGNREDTLVTVFFDFPTELDSVTVFLDAMRNYPEFGSTCHDTTYITIPLLKEAIWFPNAFTPNRDANNIWKVFGTGIISLEVDIYDRQGQIVYHYEGIENGWDGTGSNGAEMPAGNYVFVARYVNVLDPTNPLSHKGNILLLR